MSKERKEITPYKLGDTICVLDDGETYHVVLDSERLVFFANGALGLTIILQDAACEIRESGKSLELIIAGLAKISRERAIVDSIVQHCLTGK